MRSKVTLVIAPIVLILAALAILASRLGPSPTPLPPTITYVGATSDGSQLLFNIHNASSKTWNFNGYAANAPIYGLQTSPGGTRTFGHLPFNFLPSYRFGNYLIAANSKITFAVPKPPSEPTIKVMVYLYPGSNSMKERMNEHYTNKLRMFFGRPAVYGTVLQESDTVIFVPSLRN